MLLFCGYVIEFKCIWYNFFVIKICGVLEKVKCFIKMYRFVIIILVNFENFSLGFVEYLVMIEVVLIFLFNFICFCEIG